MRTGERRCWGDTSEQESLGQNLRDIRGVARCRGQRMSGITEDTVGDIENEFHGRVVGLGYNQILVRLETDTPASGDEARGELWHIPRF